MCVRMVLSSYQSLLEQQVVDVGICGVFNIIHCLDYCVVCACLCVLCVVWYVQLISASSTQRRLLYMADKT